ncbi:ParB/RepB/Spo0J family partition protein [Photobacterium carnosum]|uniref:ParB/RepB/Spo0J family partition protein n=1 Tax=Photobacterium carnosum TaxID=2023717 RepID=UPI001E2C56B7|nr:ParB/RepB/Spo0J family partition protein [Photobacterium carnosum]MCD9526951.1 hypothetical protein [Photobacterium carnosum]
MIDDTTKNKTNWWEKRTPRSVDFLRLWKENPRFDTNESQSKIKLADFVDELISESSEKDAFFDLIKSIVNMGFRNFDPIIVWKDENKRYVIAEGNRRVLALKLLRNPDKAPNSIRKFILQQAQLIDRNSIEKIQVCIAPSHQDSRWYILQRHSTSSNQKTWQRLEQQRFIVTLYDEYNQNIDTVIAMTGFKRSVIIQALRFVKLRNLATCKQITDLMNTEEKEIILSNRISMTILERWFSTEEVRERWGIQFDGMKIKITSDEHSFLNAYGHFLKLMFNVESNDLDFLVNTRTIPSRNNDIFTVLPEVIFPKKARIKELNPLLKPNASQINVSTEITPITTQDQIKQEKNNSQTNIDSSTQNNVQKPVKHSNNRFRIVSPQAQISVTSAKLNSLFSELKKLPIQRYEYASSVILRVFLDLAVDDYICKNELDKIISKEYKKDYTHTILQQRLKFLCDKHVKNSQATKVINKLLQNSNEHSLDTLNSFVHGHETHKIDYRFINGFWDMLIPLLKVLVDLKER